jgi:hypothetical protein
LSNKKFSNARPAESSILAADLAPERADGGCFRCLAVAATAFGGSRGTGGRWFLAFSTDRRRYAPQ